VDSWPRSETGEDVAELQLHGSRAVVRAVFDVLAEQGLRLQSRVSLPPRVSEWQARPDRGRGLGDLIAAETEVQRRQAVGQAGGALAKLAEAWREALLDLRAEIEARLDFSDESDVTERLPADFRQRIDTLRSGMQDALAGAASGERVREGFRVAILGRPNAGKSSLLNALSRRDVAIVTEEPGTTRDVLEVPLDLGGYPVLLFDTAGLREADSKAEAEGVRRAERTAESADLMLWLVDSTQDREPAPSLPDRPTWLIFTKIDLVGSARKDGLGISVVSGAGLNELTERLRQAAAESLGTGNAMVTGSARRRPFRTLWTL